MTGLGTATPREGSLIPTLFGGLSGAAVCDHCGAAIRTVRHRDGSRGWRHAGTGKEECRTPETGTPPAGGTAYTPTATPPAATPGVDTPPATAPPEPRRDSLGFPITGSYARLTRLREGGWRGGVDQDGRPASANIFESAERVLERVRRTGYRGDVGPDGYPSATEPTGAPTDPAAAEVGAYWVGPLEVGGVYRRHREDPFRVLAIDHNPAEKWKGSTVWAETSDGEIRSWSGSWPIDKNATPKTLYSPSHPDDPHAHEVEWLDQQVIRTEQEISNLEVEAEHSEATAARLDDALGALLDLEGRRTVAKERQGNQHRDPAADEAEITALDGQLTQLNARVDAGIDDFDAWGSVVDQIDDLRDRRAELRNRRVVELPGWDRVVAKEGRWAKDIGQLNWISGSGAAEYLELMGHDPNRVEIALDGRTAIQGKAFCEIAERLATTDDRVTIGGLGYPDISPGSDQADELDRISQRRDALAAEAHQALEDGQFDVAARLSSTIDDIDHRIDLMRRQMFGPPLDEQAQDAAAAQPDTDPPSGLDPQIPAGHESGGSTATAKEHNGMSSTTEATTHESAQAALAGLAEHIGHTKTHVETIVNGLQANGVGGETITALYAVMEQINAAEQSAKTAEDTYNRLHGQLAEAAAAAGDDAAATTGYYTGQ